MASTPADQDYAGFLARLAAKERYEAPPRSRGPEKLAGMLQLLERLGHPERKFQVVHVAGTNGKGMTSAMVARLLSASGATVGLYTSPHLTNIRERIVLRGSPIPEHDFQAVGSLVLDTAEAMGPEPYLSYFDLLTAMGMVAFAEAGMDWAVLEVGLGGFSDATNTTEKALAVITPIGLDHMPVLGNTLREIAGQKLGIVRPGVPTCVAPQQAGLAGWVEQRIVEMGSQPLAVRALECETMPPAPDRLRIWPAGEVDAVVEVDAHLATPPRLICAATALEVAEALLGPAHGKALARRLDTALLTPVPGRLDYRENLAIRNHDGAAFAVAVLDGGHNLPALNSLLAQLQTWGIQGYTLIFGMQRDKLLPALAEPLAPLFGGARRIITLPPGTPRSPSTDELHAYINGMQEKAQEPTQLLRAENPREALLTAARWPGEPLVVAGSFWTLGDVMAELDLP